MKKTIALFLTVILILLCFTSCGTSGAEIIKTQNSGVSTTIEYPKRIANAREDLIVLNIKAEGGGEKYTDLFLKVAVTGSNWEAVIPITICTPDTEISHGTFRAEYKYDGYFETSVIIVDKGPEGMNFDYNEDSDRIRILLEFSGVGVGTDIEEIVYLTGHENTLFLSKDEDTAKYRSINETIEDGDIMGGSKLVALWLFLTGQL